MMKEIEEEGFQRTPVVYFDSGSFSTKKVKEGTKIRMV